MGPIFHTPRINKFGLNPACSLQVCWVYIISPMIVLYEPSISESYIVKISVIKYQTREVKKISSVIHGPKKNIICKPSIKMQQDRGRGMCMACRCVQRSFIVILPGNRRLLVRLNLIGIGG